ncbi:MAG: hypothetical protein WA777_09080 [Rhodanobacter sp.]
MTPFTWFSLALRVIGAWIGIQSVQSLIYAFNLAKGFDTSNLITPMACVNQSMGYVVIGLLLIKFAPFLASLAYPGAIKPGPEAGEVSDTSN